MCIIKNINIYHFSLIVIAFLSASQISSALVQNGSEEMLMFPHAALDVFLLCSLQHSHPSGGQSKDSLFFLKISFRIFLAPIGALEEIMSDLCPFISRLRSLSNSLEAVFPALSQLSWLSQLSPSSLSAHSKLLLSYYPSSLPALSALSVGPYIAICYLGNCHHILNIKCY